MNRQRCQRRAECARRFRCVAHLPKVVSDEELAPNSSQLRLLPLADSGPNDVLEALVDLAKSGGSIGSEPFDGNCAVLDVKGEHHDAELFGRSVNPFVEFVVGIGHTRRGVIVV